MSNIVKIGDTEFETLVALTKDEHEVGLMFHPAPTPIMSFPYRNSSIKKFWMKDTLADLDIIFCNNNKIIDICKGSAYSLDLIGPNRASDLVVEMPFGSAKKFNINLGDDVNLKFSKQTIARIFNKNHIKKA